MKFLLFVVTLIVLPFVLVAQVQIGEDQFYDMPNSPNSWKTAFSRDGSTGAMAADGIGVRVIRLQNGVWGQVGATIPAPPQEDFYTGSFSLSADGNVVAISTAANGDTARWRVYEMVNGSWQQKGQTLVDQLCSGITRSGRSPTTLSNDGETLAVASSICDRVSIYTLVNNNWVLKGQELIGSDDMGEFIQLSGDGERLAVFSRYTDGPSSSINGQVEVFQFIGTTWQTMGSPMIGLNPGGRTTYFGEQLSFSEDGTKIACASDWSRPPGSSSFQEHGAIWVYHYDGTNWNQVGQTLFGNTSGSELGHKVAMSNAGDFLLTSTDGRTKAFRLVDNQWVATLSDVPLNVNSGYNDAGLHMNSGGTRAFITGQSPVVTGRVARLFDLTQEAPIPICDTLMLDKLKDSIESTNGNGMATRTFCVATEGFIAIGYKQATGQNGTSLNHNYEFTSNRVNYSESELSQDGESVFVDGAQYGAYVEITITEQNPGQDTIEIIDFINSPIRILVGQAAVLPIQLLSFDATPTQKQTHLAWSTANESQNAYFHIQHAPDGQNWQDIGRVNGAGTTEALQEYTFTHNNPVQGDNYYRLRQEDFDGTTDYSPVRQVWFDGIGEQLLLSPNPATDVVNISHPEGQTDTVFELINTSGQVVRKVAAGETVFSVAELPAGVYVLRARKGNYASVRLIVR